MTTGVTGRRRCSGESIASHHVSNSDDDSVKCSAVLGVCPSSCTSASSSPSVDSSILQPFHCPVTPHPVMLSENASLALENIRVLCRKGHLAKALETVIFLDQHGTRISVGPFYHLLQASITSKDQSAGREVYNLIVKHGYGSDPFLGSHLIRMFAIHGNLLEALRVFSNVSKHSLFTWHAIIAAHVMLGQGEQALRFYCRMQETCINPGEHVLVAVLKACCIISSLDCGMIMHALIVESAFDAYAYLGCTLIDMYSKCESLIDARRVFDRLHLLDKVTWSAMISGYAQHECGSEALYLLAQMQKNGLYPDSITLVSSLKACSNTRNLEYGKLIHGYALHGPGSEALRLFQRMLQDGVEPNSVTCVSLLKACCNIAALDQGRLIHSLATENSFESHIQIKSAVIDVYAKSGSLNDAKVMFDSILEPNQVIWNALIAGYSQCGDYASTVQYFVRMQQQDVRPNDVTFVCLLSSCSQLGLLEEACKAFRLLGEDIRQGLSVDHYNCMVELLARLGRIEEAEDLIRISPFQSNCVGWSSLITHCKRHGDVHQAQNCFDCLVEIDDRFSSGYAAMNDAYVEAGMWIKASRVNESKDFACAWKKPGQAFIEIQNKVHDFIVGDKSHPANDEISVKLRRLDVQMKQVGYTPEICLRSYSDEVINNVSG